MLSAEQKVIHKILYKNTLLSFDQNVIITVFLNHIKASDVIVFFNDQEVLNINKNLNNLNNDPYFFPSFSFNVNNVLYENNLKLFVKNSDGNLMSYKDKIYFTKGLIVEDNDIELQTNKFFFIKAGPSDNIIYEIEIENNKITALMEELSVNGNIYYKIKSINTGATRIIIYKAENLSENKNEIKIPFKIINVKIR
ncbi:MAG: hypothetical protein JXB50_10675 [Spirochaetes bacterium]|nr:hypothetical protein [Spirochaetota bacterium]